ncbi:hypothetical protein M406DRAFT_356069 [Cryphonectria parasitica EP155]|uniref:Uncharacterized protein n=1 Tax=Cryphonectria parasitica (strain ATCC 38755 / EP155) TaxID=660469 RepID=A0A9P4Y3R0_CRYP1|nr:uncharacterized protein M406DRAFT_356069 [Cryphonectria parasitica EP155]KAF3765822.1 hypothetical protein M406DRAFT_356069 [Cryphonectria parasitica EP155]
MRRWILRMRKRHSSRSTGATANSTSTTRCSAQRSVTCSPTRALASENCMRALSTLALWRKTRPTCAGVQPRWWNGTPRRQNGVIKQASGSEAWNFRSTREDAPLMLYAQQSEWVFAAGQHTHTHKTT